MNARTMVPTYGCRIVKAYPHDPTTFTQGLIWDGGFWESSGSLMRSTIRRIRLKDGRVLASAALPDGLFGEGIVAWEEEIVSVTWRDGIGFRWDRKSLAPRGTFRYSGEGWGLTEDGESIILSDGTPVLRFLDPATMAIRRRLFVTAAAQPVGLLNDLQWVKGEILANIHGWPLIARIDPATGQVSGWIDIAPLVAEAGGGDREKPANGVAYDAEGGRLFVTGKHWPFLYEIAVDAHPRP